MIIAPATNSNEANEIQYRLEPDLAADEFIAVLAASGLGERRPVADRARVETMLRRAGIVVTARAAGRLLGVARAVAEFAFCCYLSDLAVDRAHQRRGIGRELIQRTWDAAGRETTLVLIAAPAAVGYYLHIGMTKHEACYIFARER